MYPKLLCLLSVLLLFHTAKAQKHTEKRNYYNVYVNYPDYTVRAAIRKKPATFKASNERPYFWYAANQINSTQGGYDGKLLHGSYAAFYLNNNLKEKGRFENGLKEGKWNTWHADGKLNEIVRYNKGLRSGKYESYDSKGRPVVKATFKNGKLHGKSETYLNGEVSATRYYKDGEESVPKGKRELFKSRSDSTSHEDKTRNEKEPVTVKEKRTRKSREASRENPNSQPKSRDSIKNTPGDPAPDKAGKKKSGRLFKSRKGKTRNEKEPADTKRKSREASRENPTSQPKSRDSKPTDK